MFVRGSIETPSLLCSSFLGAGASNVWGVGSSVPPPPPQQSNIVQHGECTHPHPQLYTVTGQYERRIPLRHTAAGGILHFTLGNTRDHPDQAFLRGATNTEAQTQANTPVGGHSSSHCYKSGHDTIAAQPCWSGCCER